MFKSFLVVALRNLVRQKGFSFINITGLSLGLTACLLIGLFLYDETRYDRAVPAAERVYRVCNEVSGSEEKYSTPRTPPMYAPALRREFPEVEQSSRIAEILSKDLFEAGSRKLYEEGGIVAEQSFFDIFPLPFLYGSRANALNEPGSIVISKAMAARFFGSGDPTGREIIMEKQTFRVRGVLNDNTMKFHLKINYIIPLSRAGFPPERMQSWYWTQFSSYVRLRRGADAEALQAKFRDYIRTKVPLLPSSASVYRPFLQPLADIHLHSADFKVDMVIAEKGNIVYVRALGAIAVFILLIACFNFVNLSTARSIQRAKEVGVRKTVGASRKQLILQFLGETILLTVISIVLSAALTELFLPSLNQFTGKDIHFGVMHNLPAILLLAALTVLVGVLAGFYPALVLSAFQPIKVLKGGLAGDRAPGSSAGLRHSLIIVQFVLSAFLIISAITVFRQVDYLHSKDLGFSREQIMFFPMRGENMNRNYETFKNELLRTPGVASVSIGYGFPGDIFAGGDIIREGGRHYRTTHLMVDHDYIPTLGLQMAAGRNFSRQFGTDKDRAFIINETAVREFGFGSPEKALGQPLQWQVWNDRNPDSLKHGTIVGVVRDFHYKSLFDRLEPAVLQIFPEANWKVAVKLRTGDITGAVEAVQKVWGRFSPDYPIEYKFMDENFDQMYRAEDKLQSLIWIFTGIAIFIAGLGLFGLAAYAAERRRKEIGIRKVLGASVADIVLMLSKDLLRLVLIANIIAWPLAWLAMNGWLEDFAYRIAMSPDVFLWAGGLTLLVAFVTISLQAIKAGTTNPVLSLQNE